MVGDFHENFKYNTKYMKKAIHHIELSHTSPNISGGEKALIELVKFLDKKEVFIQYIYTSESGVEVYRKLIGDVVGNVHFIAIGGKRIEAFSEYFAFYLRVFQCLFFLRRFDSSLENIIFSHEEFLPTAIYSYLLKQLNPSAKWIAFFHMKAPSLWKGFEGEYTHKFKFPSLRLIRYRLEQGIFFSLTKKNIDKLVTVNRYYQQFLDGIYKEIYTLKKFGGDNRPVHAISHYSGIKSDEIKTFPSEKKYDLVFMGRFQNLKGLDEIPTILEEIKKEKPNIKLLMMGGGNTKVETRFFDEINRRGLKDNIEYIGFIISDERFDYLRKGRIFLFPSYYESFGQVALEAMKNGLPVIAYNIPPFEVFKKGMIKIPILDNKKMAREILRLLSDAEYYQQVQKEALNFSAEFSWDKTGMEIYDIIMSLE